jgi:hypothetical protein
MGLPGLPSPVRPEMPREVRLRLCRACPALLPGSMPMLDRCNLCGCFVAAKTAVPGQTCPAGKW